MSQEIETLTEMGFSREKAERALAVTNNKGVEPAMEWLLAHADEPIPQVCITEATPATATATAEPSDPAIAPEAPGASSVEASDSMDVPASSSADSDVAKSLKCGDCGKLFAGQTEVEYHAAKTGHCNFSESTEEKKPLTDEEKKEQLAKLEERMKQKRKEREEKLKAEELEKERIRIKSGKDMQDAKHRLQEQEMQKVMEERRRDKLEDQKARERVRQNILADKEARRLAAQGIKPGDEVPAPAPIAAPIVAPPSPNRVAPTSARLQLRLPDGRAVTQTFGAREQLSAVRLYLQINEMHNKDFGLMTTFPRRVFIEEDYEKPLDTLGLTPSAVVIVSKVGQPI